MGVIGVRCATVRRCLLAYLHIVARTHARTHANNTYARLMRAYVRQRVLRDLSTPAQTHCVDAQHKGDVNMFIIRATGVVFALGRGRGRAAPAHANNSPGQFFRGLSNVARREARGESRSGII